jgi:hypothetical protein
MDGNIHVDWQWIHILVLLSPCLFRLNHGHKSSARFDATLRLYEAWCRWVTLSGAARGINNFFLGGVGDRTSPLCFRYTNIKKETGLHYIRNFILHVKQLRVSTIHM